MPVDFRKPHITRFFDEEFTPLWRVIMRMPDQSYRAYETAGFNRACQIAKALWSPSIALHPRPVAHEMVLPRHD